MAAEVIQFFLSEGGDLFEVEVFVDIAGRSKGVFLSFEAVEAI